jgi:prophage antirepressor-like protein
MLVDGQPHFVAKDVADRLGYANARQALITHCRGVQKLYAIQDPLGRVQHVRIIDETDVFRLIAGSHLPAAERFSDWVFEEVLPSIRRTGRYVGAPPAEESREVKLAQGLLLAHEVIAQERAEKAALAAENTVLALESDRRLRRAERAEAEVSVTEYECAVKVAAKDEQLAALERVAAGERARAAEQARLAAERKDKADQMDRLAEVEGDWLCITLVHGSPGWASSGRLAWRANPRSLGGARHAVQGQCRPPP